MEGDGEIVRDVDGTLHFYPRPHMEGDPGNV